MGLDQVWKRQKEFQKLVDQKVWENQSADSVIKTKEYLLCLITEAVELLNEFDWKLHRKKFETPNRERIFVELIDIFKYWLNIGLEWGMTTEEFLRVFQEKSTMVEERFVRDHKNE